VLIASQWRVTGVELPFSPDEADYTTYFKAERGEMAMLKCEICGKPLEMTETDLSTKVVW
jgi:transcription elongation factor Elf1